MMIVGSNNKSNWCDKIRSFPDKQNELTDILLSARALVVLDRIYRNLQDNAGEPLTRVL